MPLAQQYDLTSVVNYVPVMGIGQGEDLGFFDGSFDSLNHNPIWISGVSKEWESQLPHAKRRTFKAKECIPSTLDDKGSVPGFYYMKYGKARALYCDVQGREVTLYHLGEGTLMYDLSICSNGVPYSLHALTPIEAYFFSTAQFFDESFVANNPKLFLSFMCSQALKNAYYMRRIITISGGNAFANTCKLMLELSRAYGGALDVPMGVTHEEIASLLCVRRSWLGKILRRLKDENVISRCTKARLVIADMEKLRRYAAD